MPSVLERKSIPKATEEASDSFRPPLYVPSKRLGSIDKALVVK